MMNLPECDYCESTDSIRKIGDSLVCPECIKKGAHVPNVPAPIAIGEVLKVSREIDNSVKVNTDIFNAATVSIVELKKAIDEDESITNKPYALAVELQTRFNKHKEVIFGLNQQIVEETNRQKAIQIYLNNLANQLRQDEREKLRLQDINYQPRTLKMPVSPKTIKMSKKKLDTKELKARATELGIPEFTLRMICIQKNLSVEDGYKLFKANIEAAKAKVTPAE